MAKKDDNTGFLFGLIAAGYLLYRYANVAVPAAKQAELDAIANAGGPSGIVVAPGNLGRDLIIQPIREYVPSKGVVLLGPPIREGRDGGPDGIKTIL